MSEFIWKHVSAWHGGTVHSVALASSADMSHVALAASDAGLFRSGDGGRTWARVHDLAYTAIRVVACAANDARIAFAAAQNGDLFRSVDRGESWQRVNNWAFGAINDLALSPNYLQDHVLFASTQDGIYRSLNDGTTWQSASFGLLDAEVLCLTCAPDFAISEVVWAGSAAGGLYRSRNAGRAWRELGDGLADAAVQCIALGVGASTLFAGTEGGGVFRSTNVAHLESFGLDGMQVNCLAISNGVLFAGTGEGVFLLEDDGRSWQCTMADDVVLTLAAASNGIVIAGCLVAGVLTSADGGRTWQRPTKSVSAHVPPHVAQSPDGALFMFDTVGSAARITNIEASWVDIQLDDGPIHCVAAGGSAQQPRVIVGTSRDVFKWHAEANAFKPLVNQPVLDDDDAISALAVTSDGMLLLGTQAGMVAILVDDGIAWHTLAIPGTGTVSAVRLTPSSSLFVLRLAPAGNATFNAEVWRMPELVLPAIQTVGDWCMVAALDALRVPLAYMTIETGADSERVILAGQNIIAVATLSDGHANTATLPDGTTITSLVVAHGCMFVAANQSVYATADDGLTRQLTVGSLVDAPVVALFADEKGLVAIALGGDKWRCDISS